MHVVPDHAYLLMIQRRDSGPVYGIILPFLLQFQDTIAHCYGPSLAAAIVPASPPRTGRATNAGIMHARISLMFIEIEVRTWAQSSDGRSKLHPPRQLL